MPLSLELSTLANFENGLDALDPAARYRVLLFLNLKYEIDTEKQEARVKTAASTGTRGAGLAAIVALPATTPSTPHHEGREKLIPMRDAAKLPGVARSTLFTAVKQKRIRSEMIDGIAHVLPSDVKAYFQRPARKGAARKSA